MTYDETISALEALVGERVCVCVAHAEGQVLFARIPGMLRRVEPHFLEQAVAEDQRISAAFYVDGGQVGGSLPAVLLYEELFVGLDPEDGFGVGWAHGNTVTMVGRLED